MWKVTILVATAFAVFGAAAPAAADVQISLQNGRVTIVAKDATVRQILVEWERVGQTKIVNVERIPGSPLTIELRDVPEQEALKTLLRSISGYVTAPRAGMVANASMFDRIIVMPTLAAAAAPISTAPPPPPPAFATFQPPQQPLGQDDDRDEPRPNPAAPLAPPANRPSAFSFPQPQVTTAPPAGQAGPTQATQPLFPLQPAAPTVPPSALSPGTPALKAPAGVAVPGMVVPAPTPQPGGAFPVSQPAPQP